MNKKGFTLIELIATVVIMAIIALLATPNIISMIDKGNKRDYVSDAKEFISKATYMYKQDKYQPGGEEPCFDSSGKIWLEDIKGLKSEDKKDPYGNDYKLGKEDSSSFIIFKDPTEFGERQVHITLESCNTEKKKCYKINNVEKNQLSEESVEEYPMP